MRNFKYLDVILGVFVAVLLISNIASAAKIVTLGPFTYDAGTLLFPLSYIFSDVLTEVYGYSASRRVIWIGFGSLTLMAAVIFVVGILPGEAQWQAEVGQAAFDRIFSLTPRIVLASLVAYWCGSFANDFVLAKLKIRTAGRMLWLRTIGSTLIGEGIDTLIFCTIAFLGALPGEVLVAIIVSNYVFKVGVEAIFTPLTYAIVNSLKKAEHVDVYDRDTDFNPFKMEPVAAPQP